MAKVIIEDNPVVRQPWQVWLRVVGFGAAAGLLFWILTLLIGRYIVEPLACRDVVDAAACTGAAITAGRISTIIVAVAAVFSMVRFGMARPIVVAAAAAALLWDLAAYTLGLFWLESLLWSVVLYALVYALFAWVVRATSIVMVIILTLVLVIGIRVLLLL